jgi:hypothetical protein
MPDDFIVTVTDDSGGVAFYTIANVFVETYGAIERVYALLLSVQKTSSGSYGGMVVRYHPQKPDDQAVEAIEDEGEMAVLMNHVYGYLQDNGLLMDRSKQ